MSLCLRVRYNPMMLGENDGLKGCGALTAALEALDPLAVTQPCLVMPFRARCVR